MRPFFIGLSIALGFSINPFVLAQNASADIQNLIQNFKLNKSDVAAMIDRLQKSGQINQSQAEDAKKRLKGMSEGELKELSMEAFTNVSQGQPLFADEKAQAAEEKAESTSSQTESKGAGRLPASPFFSLEEASKEFNIDEKERKKLEEAQEEILKSGFDIKKFQ